MGRDAELGQIAAFVRGDAPDASAIGLVIAAAGAGKSRLLKAVTESIERPEESIPAMSVRVASREPITPQAYELLPRSPGLLLVVDDAQDLGEQLRSVRACIRRERPKAKILLATRPYGMPAVREALRALGIDQSRTPQAPCRSWCLSAVVRTGSGAGVRGDAYVEPRIPPRRAPSVPGWATWTAVRGLPVSRGSPCRGTIPRAPENGPISV